MLAEELAAANDDPSVPDKHGQRVAGSRATAGVTETCHRDAAIKEDRTRHCGHVKFSARLKPLVHVQGGQAGRRQPAHRVPVCQRPPTCYRACCQHIGRGTRLKQPFYEYGQT